MFDLDGVLVDTARFHYLAWKELADKLGFHFSEEHNERLKGISRMESLRILLEIGRINLSDQEKMKYAEEKNEVYLAYVNRMTPADVLPGVTSLLHELRERNIATGLGSASKNARVILEKTGIEPLFDVIVDGTLVTHAKPDPEVFETGARLLQTENSSCVVFEDAVAGIQAAHHAGMKCVGIGSPEILHEADLVFPGLEGIRIDDLKFRD